MKRPNWACKGRVQFLGDRRDIAAVLASVDVSMVPSASESLSNVMLESMAAGVPVVATDVGGNRELAGDGRAVAGCSERCGSARGWTGACAGRSGIAVFNVQQGAGVCQSELQRGANPCAVLRNLC